MPPAISLPMPAKATIIPTPAVIIIAISRRASGARQAITSAMSLPSAAALRRATTACGVSPP